MALKFQLPVRSGFPLGMRGVGTCDTVASCVFWTPAVCGATLIAACTLFGTGITT
jgi:hypothetical protein